MDEIQALEAALPGWRVIRLVDQGGQKRVFEAISPEGERVALKIAPASDRSEARLERELRAMTLASSNHLVRVVIGDLRHVDIEGTELLYYAEEFIDGITIQEMERPWDDQEDVIALGLELGEAVGALWAHRIVHRDIKPTNVMRAQDERFVLLDPGLARHQDLSSLTVADALPGTRFWRSPEQLRRYRRELDFRSDLFLVGQLMFLTATGHHPFLVDVETEDEYEGRVLSGEFPHPETLRADLRTGLGSVIRRLLSPHPHLRYRAVDRFLSSLSAVRG